MLELLRGYLYLLIYIGVLLPVILWIRVKTKIETEVFRKMLHCVFLGIIPIWLYCYENWYIGVIACIGMMILLYPVLTLAGKMEGFSEFITERNSGELKASLIIVFLMFAAVTAVCRGIFDDRLLALASVYAWGPGDAAAALVGKRFGKHKIKVGDGKKSFEGSGAMFASAFICVFVILFIRGGLGLFEYSAISLIAAFVAAAAELFSKNGNDTIICPLAAMAILIAMLGIFGGI